MIFRVFSRKFSTKSNIVTLVKELIFEEPVGTVKKVQGWVTSVRKMGKLVFLDVSDGSCFEHLQVVVPKENLESPIQNGSSLTITGTIQKSHKGQLELLAEKIWIVGCCNVADDYPFNLKEKQSYDYYRQYLHFRPKIKYFSSMMRFRSAASQKIHNYFSEDGFTFIHTPILTSGDCEGAAETFLVKPESEELIKAMKKENVHYNFAFFDSPAFLTVSGQLHLEAVARSIAKVYTFNPCFRAENSISRLHLSEFYMVEAEEAFMTDLESVMCRIEDCMKKVITHLLANHNDEMGYVLHHNETDTKKHFIMLENAVNKPFSVMTFSEAKEIINKNQGMFIKSNLSPFDLTKAEELFLVDLNDKLPLFIINWPKISKPFYMKEIDENSDLVKGVDLLVPNVGELCGGSVREDNYDILKKKLTDMNILNSLQWYLDIRKFGNVPTAGFGLGFDRLVQFLLNIQSIKDAIPFPRWPHHLKL